MKLYGIAHCSTVKQCRAWLADRGREAPFHDYAKQGVDPQRLRNWAAQVGWEIRLNRKGTTWRKLSEAEQARVTTADAALRLMQQKPSLIERPVLETGQGIVVGFDPETYSRLFAQM